MILFGILVMGLRLGGCSLGLLGGLGLTLFAFCGYCMPLAPPSYDLLILQAAWLILMSTLEAVHFFDLVESKFNQFVSKVDHHIIFVALLCYCLVFVTGNRKFVYSIRSNNTDSLASLGLPSALMIVMSIAAHMALLVSPLSISGLLLLVVLGHSSWSTVDFMGSIIAITIGIIISSGILIHLIPLRWFTKLYYWFMYCEQDDPIIAYEETKSRSADIPLMILLLLGELVLFCLQPTRLACSRIPYFEMVFPVRLAMFFVLLIFAMAAVVMLCYNLKPAKMLQTARFKAGIQQFFILLGLTWLIETLLNADLGNVLLCNKTYYAIYLDADQMVYHFLCYGIVFFCMLIIDLPIIIWLFVPLFLVNDCSILQITMGLVGLHILSPFQYWMSKMMNSHCHNDTAHIKK